MAEPNYLHLRSDRDFKKEPREAILNVWQKNFDENDVNVKYGAEVVEVAGEQSGFMVSLVNGNRIQAESIGGINHH